MFNEFKQFIQRGNVVDMAVGIIIGAAFATVISTLVDDVLMPVIGLAIGGIDFSNLFVTLKDGAAAGPYPTLEAAKEAGAVTVAWGLLVNALITFLIVGFAVFLLVRSANSLKKEAEKVAAEPSNTDKLLGEIRDLLRDK
ncbi:large-conductance mechanosensitive channel protein MscL [Gammaproteobacteria bacterium]|nr:large-conductance mechanosensitive channel protein MscL [Gammaproteobacteria bacterium]